MGEREYKMLNLFVQAIDKLKDNEFFGRSIVSHLISVPSDCEKLDSPLISNPKLLGLLILTFLPETDALINLESLQLSDIHALYYFLRTEKALDPELINVKKIQNCCNKILPLGCQLKACWHDR